MTADALCGFYSQPATPFIASPNSRFQAYATEQDLNSVRRSVNSTKPTRGSPAKSLKD
jgi:hypothetical protein